ncbi:MAG: cytochrome c [Pseudomonadota bacterium]
MKRLLIVSIFTLGLAGLPAHAAGSIEAGKAAAAKYNCAACHGADYNSPIDPSYPKLAGQHRDYLVHSLIGYQRGVNGANGRGNAIMSAQAKMLSRDDVRNIAAYLHSLPGSLVLGK